MKYYISYINKSGEMSPSSLDTKLMFIMLFIFWALPLVWIVVLIRDIFGGGKLRYVSKKEYYENQIKFGDEL